VMLFQMLTGDVPFKGSSIPAIMKKHLTDPPPSFADLGVIISPEVEKVVRHSLEKEPEKRIASVEQFVDELRDAIGLSVQGVGMVSGSKHPVSSLRILTNPPQSKVFIDNVAIGESRPDGWLILDGLQSGSHHVTVRHAGYKDWENNVICDGSPQQVIANLEKSESLPHISQGDTFAIPKPGEVPGETSSDIRSQNFAKTQTAGSVFQQTNRQNWETGEQSVEVESEPQTGFFSPVVLAIGGILGLFILTTVGIGGAYLFGFIGGSGPGTNVNSVASPTPAETPLEIAKPVLIEIPGGTFRMGRNDGGLLEKPENDVTVDDFYLGRTEVTNGEYFEFVKETGHKPLPSHWEKDGPLQTDLKKPVRYVSVKDAEAFIKWRSAKDGVDYRLPTEEEWEYAARNGSKNNLYPWGDQWDEEAANVDIGFNFKEVGTNPRGQNDWQVQDLIGNVWEWTSSRASSYKGSDPQLAARIEKLYGKTANVVRGAFDPEKGVTTASSTFRGFAPETHRDKVIGFRLARSK